MYIDETHKQDPQCPRQASRSPPLLHRHPRGSLLQRHIRHRSGCAVCARGEGHLISVLTVSYPGGRTKQISLRPEQKPLVERWLRNYRQIKATLERICELNHQRLRAERNSDR